jgi:hypothetical protein
VRAYADESLFLMSTFVPLRSGLALALVGLLAALIFGATFYWLWKEYLLLGLIASLLLLGSGRLFLIDSNIYLHATSLGALIGAFLGTAFGIRLMLGV